MPRLAHLKDMVYYDSNRLQNKTLFASEKSTVELIHRRFTGLHRGVHDPDLRLPGSLGHRFEPGQKHIIQEHEPLTNFPWDGPVRPLLWFDLSDIRCAIQQRGKLTAIASKYCFSFLATWYASSPRVIGSRSLFQRVVKICYRSQCVITHPERVSYLD